MSFPISNLFTASPLVLSPPGSGYVSTATTGGTIAASTVVTFVVTAIYGGIETAASPNLTVTTGSGTATNTATVMWARVPGATSYNVYASTGAGTLAKVATGATVTYYAWTGTAGSGAVPGASGFTEATATPGLWVCPNGVTGTVSSLTISNPSTVDWGQVYLSAVKSGGSGGAATRLIGGAAIPPDVVNGKPTVLKVLRGFVAGDFITGYATLPGIVISADGLLG